jgi:glyoxylase-like metal-dependent hydrolase (beta-lactamase superfamily II)
VRVQVSAGTGGRGYGRGHGVRADSNSACWELVELLPAPAERSLTLTVLDDGAVPLPAFPNVKSCNALPHVMCARLAAHSGCEEALRVSDGSLLEAAASNVFWTSETCLFTPSASLPLYPGVTRSVVLSVAEAEGWTIREGRFGASDLAQADSVFLTNPAVSLLQPEPVFRSIAPGCARAVLPSPWPPGVVAVFLIGDDAPWLLDTGPGTPDSDDDLSVALRARVKPRGAPSGVILSHGHLDHVGGLGCLRLRLVLVHRDAAMAMRADGRLPDGVDALELEGEHGPLSGSDGWEWVLGEGHAPGHVLPWHAESRTLIVGDQFLHGLKTPLRVADPDEDSYGVYLETVRRVAALEPRIMFPSHTEPIRDPERWLKQTERRMARQLDRTLRAIRSQARTAEDVVAALYRALPSEGARQLLLREQTAALRHLHLIGEVTRSSEGNVERFEAARP